VTLKEGSLLDPELLRKAVVESDFTPRDITITAKGVLRSWKKAPVLSGIMVVINDTGQEFVLLDRVPEAPGIQLAGSPTSRPAGASVLLQRAQSALSAGKTKIRVTGVVHMLDDHILGLIPDDLTTEE